MIEAWGPNTEYYTKREVHSFCLPQLLAHDQKFVF